MEAMTWKSLAFDLVRAGRWVLKLLYPPTKRKLRRLLHVAGTALTVALLVSAWMMERLTLAESVAADLLVLATYLTRWQAVIGRLDQAVDKLPIPEEDALLGQVVRGSLPEKPAQPPP